MPNTFVTSDLAVQFASEFEVASPILMNTNRNFDAKFVANNGDTISVILPGYGASATQGQDLSAADLTYTASPVSVTVLQYRKGVSTSAVEQALKIEDFKGQIAAPYAGEFSADIQGKVADKMMASAATAVVVNSYSASANGFQDLGKAVSYIKSAKIVGDTFGCLSHDLSALVTNGAANLFNPVSNISDMWTKGKLGQFRGAEFYDSADISALVTTTRAVSATVKTEVNTDATGDYSTIVFTGTNTGTLTAGEIFTISGVKNVNVYGKATVQDFAFVVQETVAFNANEATVKVQPLFFKPASGIKPAQNVSVSTIAAGTAITMLTAQNKSYARGLVWNKNAVVYVSRKLPALAVPESADGQGEAVSILMQRQANLLQGIDLTTWDALIGSKIVRPNGVSQVLIAM